jgi:hypothetical protein
VTDAEIQGTFLRYFRFSIRTNPLADKPRGKVVDGTALGVVSSCRMCAGSAGGFGSASDRAP